MKKNIIQIFLFCTIIFLPFAAASQQTKEELTKQRQSLMKEIDDLNASLKNVQKEGRSILKILEQRRRKVAALADLVDNINRKIKILDDDLYLKQVEIYRLNKELDTLKANYKKSVVFAYKNRSNYQYLNFLFSSKNFNDVIKRVAYLKGYRKLREAEADRIKNTQIFLQQNIAQLNTAKDDKKQTLVAQTEQLKNLEEAKKEQEEHLKQIKGQEKDLFAQISKKEKQRRELSNAINIAIKKEIAEAEKKERERIAKIKADAEAKKKQLEAEAKAKADAAAKAKADADAKTKADAVVKAEADAKAKKAEEDAKLAEQKSKTFNNEVANAGKTIIGSSGKQREYSAFEGTKEGLKMSEIFENNKHKLGWPVDIGQVCGEFGPAKIIKIDVINDGIFICLPIGTTVKVVADGVVTSVQDMGDYSYVMVRHGKYRTIYNKLSSVTVSVGQNLTAGSIVGKAALSDSNGEGEIEFRVMNGNNKFENPRNWLKAR